MSCQLLHRIDTDRNMARFYAVETSCDLFGHTLVERRWGRIGGQGQRLVLSFPTAVSAELAATRLLRVKERRGYIGIA
jgi:predicted DNA-binding WGR domain protein